jgi:cyclase
MIRSKPRVIPILLLKNAGLYKTEKFKNPKYIGDPINAVKIFNDKEVDELAFLDITASQENREPNFEMIRDIASECFMPLSYGGGVRSVDIIREVLNVGVEKVSINTEAVRNPELISQASKIFGSSTIIVSIDVKKNLFGKYQVYINDGLEKTALNPIDWAKEVENRGAGEILINAMDHDGMMQGYDYDLIKAITGSVGIPVVAAGGAGSIQHFVKAVKDSHASAVAAGAFFVFQGKHKAVLITYPDYEVLQKEFNC